MRRSGARDAGYYDPEQTVSTLTRKSMPQPEIVGRFLTIAPESPVEAFGTPRIGQNLRFRTPDRAGSAMVCEGVVVHLELLPAGRGAQRQAVRAGGIYQMLY
jgi:hypothetical protein